MKEKDPVGEFLRKRGCPEHVVMGGLRGLTESWEEVVRSVEKGYSQGLDDYLNDMDSRQLIEEGLHIAPAREKETFLKQIRQADAKMQWLVKPSGRCLWGDETARREGWTAEKNWWYFSIPIHPGEELLGDIDEF
jgi:hypothetical protein